ncbi:MAG: hypothetical protein LC753_08970, partial [Acidobacteria bacterium]|nr:hypothetical protein [Acidobacteriota bacterium]
EHCSPRDVDSPVYAWPADLVSGGDWTSCDGYVHTVFLKGSDFLSAIRAEMGDSAFFAALRDFVERHRHGVVTTRVLLDHLENWDSAELMPIYLDYVAAYGRPPDAPRAGRAV